MPQSLLLDGSEPCLAGEVYAWYRNVWEVRPNKINGRDLIPVHFFETLEAILFGTEAIRLVGNAAEGEDFTI